MYSHDAIGLDPDSRNCVAALIKRGQTKPIYKTFSLSQKGKQKLIDFIQSYPDCLVGIEGKRGQNEPLESSFNKTGIIFYNIPPIQITHYRKAMINQNKSNENDAFSVARFILDQQTAGTLEEYRYKVHENGVLRKLSRYYIALSQQSTLLENRLWKQLKSNANELYLSLSSDGESSSRKKLGTIRFLNLLLHEPEINSWKYYTDDDFLKYSGGKKLNGWIEFLERIKKGMEGLDTVSIDNQMIIEQTAEQLLANKRYLLKIEKRISGLVHNNPLLDSLITSFKGLGVVNASVIMGEIGNIKRFIDDDHLASYAGLTKIDDSTGNQKHQVRSKRYNARLKNGFVNFSIAYLRNNKDSHLYHYHKHLLKLGYGHIEALIRVARALVRKIFRYCRDYQEEKRETVAEGKTITLPESNTNLPNSSLIPKNGDVKITNSA